MAEIVGEAQVNVSADTTAAELGLRRLREDFDRSMAAMDRQSAEAKLAVDTTALDRGILEAKKKLEVLDKQKAESKVLLHDKEFNRVYAETEAKIKRLNGQKAEIRVGTRELKDANREMAMLDKRQATQARATERQMKLNDSIARQREKSIDQGSREGVQIAKLRQEYAKLAGEQRRLSKTGRPNGIFRTAKELRDLDLVNAKLADTSHRLRRLGQDTDHLSPIMEEHQGRLFAWAKSLAKVRVSMGPISGTLKQMAIGFLGLSPIIIGLLGSISSLVGVLGTGLAGALSVGIGFMEGFGLSALGIGMALRPVLKDLGAATAATKAYNAAVLKYGQNSSQAKDKLDQLNNTMKGISPVARRAVQDFVGLQSQWQKLTSGVRKPIFETFAEGIKTAKALLPTFAHQTVATMKTLSDGMNKWLQDLRSPEAKGAITSLMANFRQGLPGLMAGLGNIVGMLTNIGVSASKLWPSLSKGFEKWTEALSNSVGSGNELDGKIARLVDHMQTLGHFAQATGRLLITFFSLGADSGKNLLATFTATENRWSDWMQSMKGKNAMRDWFDESATTTKEFFSVIGGISKLLFEVGRATAPIVQGLLKIVTIVGDVVDALMGLAPTRAILTGLGTVLGTAFAVSKVIAFGKAIKGVVTTIAALSGGAGLKGIASALGFAGAGAGARTAEKGVIGFGSALEGATATASGLGAVVGGVFAAIGVATYLSIKDAEKLAKQWEVVKRNVGGSVPKKGVYGTQELEDLSAAMTSAGRQAKLVVPSYEAWKQSTLDVEFAQRNARDAVKQFGKGSLEAQQAALQLSQSQHVLAKQTLNFKATTADAFDSAQTQIDAAKSSQEKYNTALSDAKGAARELYDETARAHPLMFAKDDQAAFDKFLKGNERYQVALDAQTAGSRRVRTSMAQMAGEGVNWQRVVAGFKPLTDAATLSAGRFTRQFGKIPGAKKLVVNADNSGAVTKLQRTSKLLTNVGGRKATVDILGNSKNAEQAANRIEQKLRSVARQKYDAKIGVIDNASAKGSTIGKIFAAVAKKRYDARISAIDSASGKVKGVQAQVDRFSHGQYKAKVDADTDAARSAIQQINDMLSSTNGRVANTKVINTIETKYTTSGSPPGHATGAAIPASSPSSKRVDTGGQITRPQYVVGEEAPRYNETIITENPSRRASNVGYLKSAAQGLGMRVIPGYAGGGQHKPKHKKKKKDVGPSVNNNFPGADEAAHKLSPYDYWTAQVEYWGGKYSNTRSNAEAYQDPNATGIPVLPYGELLNDLDQEFSAYGNVGDALLNQIKGAEKRRKTTAKTANSFNDGKIETLTSKDLPAAEASFKQAKNLFDKTGKKSKDYDTNKSKMENAQQKVESLKQRLKDLKQGQKDQVKSANTSISDLNNQIAAWQREHDVTIPNSRQGVANERRQLADQQAGTINSIPPLDGSDTPAGTAAAALASIGLQTGISNSARQDLYRQFGSNIISSDSGLLAGGYGGSSAYTGNEGAGSALAAGGIGAVAGLTGGTSGSSGAGSSSQSVAAPAGKTVQITNNFAAPPPDPHTWTQQQNFEVMAVG